jgi:large subunit ribosomal protein L14e
MRPSKMFEIGRIAVKTAGRDAGKKAVIINVLDEKYVVIDGETRRRKCNIAHLEALEKVIQIKKDASHDEVKKAFGELGLKVRDTKPKEKKEIPKKVRKKKETVETEKKVVKKKRGKRTNENMEKIQTKKTIKKSKKEDKSDKKAKSG